LSKGFSERYDSMFCAKNEHINHVLVFQENLSLNDFLIHVFDTRSSDFKLFQSIF